MLNNRLLPELVLNSVGLIHSNFNQELAAGAINGVASIPYGGLFFVVDTLSKLSMTGGNLVFASANPASGNPLLTYNNNLLRKIGRTVKSSIIPVSGTAPARIGWNSVYMFPFRCFN